MSHVRYTYSPQNHVCVNCLRYSPISARSSHFHLCTANKRMHSVHTQFRLFHPQVALLQMGCQNYLCIHAMGKQAAQCENQFGLNYALSIVALFPARFSHPNHAVYKRCPNCTWFQMDISMAQVSTLLTLQLTLSLTLTLTLNLTSAQVISEYSKLKVSDKLTV